MKTYLITGGTDGMGKALAIRLLKDGEQVVVVGSSSQKGELFLAEAGRIGSDLRAFFIRADLSLVSEIHRIIADVSARFDALDGLIFCAVNFTQRAKPLITAEGFESSFALLYLSRFIMSYELTGLLEKSEKPIIVNFCSPGMYVEVQWDNLQYTRNFESFSALVQSGKLNDHLGVSYAANNPAGKVKYVLYNPGSVKTSGIMRELNPELLAHFNEFGRTAEDAVEPLMPVLGNPPSESLYAFNVEGERGSLDAPSFDSANALRLHSVTTELLGGLK